MKKWLSIWMILLCVSVCLTACGNAGGEDTETTAGTDEAGTTTSSVQQTESAVPEAEPLAVIAQGAPEYKVVRSDDSSDAVKDAAIALYQALTDTYGAKLGITTDFEKKGTDPATRYAYEILVGPTNREESVTAQEQIKYNDVLIAVSGTRVVVTGGCDDAVVEAVNYFIENYVKGTELLLESDLHDAVAAEYPQAGLKLDGVDISEYTIVYSSSLKNAALEIADRIGDRCGAILTVVNSNNYEATGRDIILCDDKLNGVKVADMAYDSFDVVTKNGSVHVIAGSMTSGETACARMLDVLLGGKTEVALKDLELSYDLPDRQEYIEDISKFALNWELYFDTPEWMLDYDEKYAAMLDADGRLMSCLHRGDMQKYPENSIEGIISSIMMGGDMVEIDPRRTKDGVLVLLHDATLTRTTNYSEMAGKNGLPTSAKISDWTYEQLMQLNLKEGAGGNNARVTEFKIPTLDEAFKVCANRIFIRLDVKADDAGVIFWDYAEDIWPLMTKYKSYTNVIYTWHAAFSDNSYALIKEYNAKQKELCGKTAIYFSKGSGTATGILKTIEVNDTVFDPTIRLTDFNLANISYKTYLASNSPKLAQLKGEVRIYVDAHGTNKDYPENAEGPVLYEALNGAGINLLLVNKGFDLCTYIAENFEAAQK